MKPIYEIEATVISATENEGIKLTADWHWYAFKDDNWHIHRRIAPAVLTIPVVPVAS